jgi:crotonobetainyl-CoA:carnitine CoA-transferase CaiB-like acyl-CoA transferase
MTGEEIEKWDSAELLLRFQEEGVPCAPLLDRMELMTHEQIIANGSINRTVFDGFGEVRQARPAAQFSESPSNIDTPAPKLGQHGREILTEIGYDDAHQQQLIDAGVMVIAE